MAFAQAPAQQLFWLAGLQVAGAASVRVNAVNTVIGLVPAWPAPMASATW